MKMRRFKDDRINGDIPLVKIAIAGGMEVNRKDVETIDKHGVDSRGKAIIPAVELKSGKYSLTIYRNLKMKCNYPGFDLQKAREKMHIYRDYFQKEKVNRHDRRKIFKREKC